MKNIKVLRALVVASLLGSSAMAEGIIASAVDSVKEAIMPAKTAYANASLLLGMGTGVQAAYGDRLFPLSKFGDALPGNVGWEADANVIFGNTTILVAGGYVTYIYDLEAVKGLQFLGAVGLGLPIIPTVTLDFAAKLQAKYAINNQFTALLGVSRMGFSVGAQIAF